MRLPKPKLRELKEAVTVLFSPRFTSRFPHQACKVPDKYRGKPQIDTDNCIGCGACVNVCPTEALTQKDITDAEVPAREITCRYDTCIFCGNCRDNCTTKDGINLTDQWDLAGLDRSEMSKTCSFELQMCEKCGSVIGTKKHLAWLAETLGPLAYTNPSLLLTKDGALRTKEPKPDVSKVQQKDAEPETSDFMRLLCPKCRRQLNIKL